MKLYTEIEYIVENLKNKEDIIQMIVNYEKLIDDLISQKEDAENRLDKLLDLSDSVLD